MATSKSPANARLAVRKVSLSLSHRPSLSRVLKVVSFWLFGKWVFLVFIIAVHVNRGVVVLDVDVRWLVFSLIYHMVIV